MVVHSSPSPFKNSNIPFFTLNVNDALYLLLVENILKGSLDSIPSHSPSVKIQIMGGKVCLRCKGKILLGLVNKLLKTKKNLDNAQKYFAFTPQANFPAHNLNFP